MLAFLGRVGRVLRKPPGYVARRLVTELRAATDRWHVPARQARFDDAALLAATGAESVDELWQTLARRAYPAHTSAIDRDVYDTLFPGDAERILEAADAALRHEVDFLGSGVVQLGEDIDWGKDYVSGFAWAPAYMRDIEYADLDRGNDVKFPWELSRLQWLIPVGQAYLLTSDLRYAEGARKILDHWISSNPCTMTVNWACAMEAAMRIFSWTWLFHTFADSAPWTDAAFRSRFLRTLYLHGEFTERYIERSDINGNHFTADAAALVVIGNFFARGVAPQRWSRSGWQELLREIALQVYEDGVCFEMSTAYHRLVTELFYWAAAHRLAGNASVPESYLRRLRAMAAFADAYTRPDGRVPLWGDADDARVLPFGGQHVNDHRYLPALVRGLAAGPLERRDAECFWVYGQERATAEVESAVSDASSAFVHAGVFVMRNQRNHVFIDCAPVGTGGRGGHGHNDCLAVDAYLDGVHVLSDCGSYTYTREYRWRNRFRSSSFHNSPIVDDQEQNRFVSQRYLWNLHYDAQPQVLGWHCGQQYDVFSGEHRGFDRLADPVRVKRLVVLAREASRLLVCDRFECSEMHAFSVPLQLAEGGQVLERGEHSARIGFGDRSFLMVWQSRVAWQAIEEQGWVSPSYGVRIEAPRLVLSAQGCSETLQIAIIPGLVGEQEALRWISATMAVAASREPGGTTAFVAPETPN